MNLNNKELLFLDIFLKYKKNYDYIINKSLKYKIFFKKDDVFHKMAKIQVSHKSVLKEYNFIPIGYINKNNFVWINGMNKLFYDHFIVYPFNKKYLTKKLIKYLFNNEIDLEDKYKYIIPYIISFTNPAYNVIEFVDPDNVKFFALIDLKIIDNFTYQEKFLKNLKEKDLL